MKTIYVSALYLIITVNSVCFGQHATLLLKVQANFDNQEMKILAVDQTGPAAKLRNEQFPQGAMAEPGDVIELIDGRPIKSHSDFIDAMNSSLDGSVRLTIRNVNDGKSIDFWTQAEPRSIDDFTLAKDTYYRAAKAGESSFSYFSFSVTEQFVCIVNPLVTDNLGGDDRFRLLMLEIASIEQHVDRKQVFQDATLQRCNQIAAAIFHQLPSLDNTQLSAKTTEASKSIREILRADIETFAQRTERKVVQESTVAEQVQFKVVSGVPSASVQILPAADAVLTMLKHGAKPNEPISEDVLEKINSLIQWKTLPADNARAYGRYYYRFVNGEAVPPLNQFNKNRQITITPSTPKDGVIVFGK